MVVSSYNNPVGSEIARVAWELLRQEEQHRLLAYIEKAKAGRRRYHLWILPATKPINIGKQSHQAG